MTAQGEIHKLAVHNRKLYEQLKARELEYIDLIRDLHEENHRLRQLLQINDPATQSKVNKIVLHRNHQKTPSFNSAANSMVKDGEGGVSTNQGAQQEDQRFSFAVRNNVSIGQIAKKLQIVPPQMAANNVQIIRPTKQQPTTPNRLHSIDQLPSLPQKPQADKHRVIESVDNEGLWSQKTYQSIGRDESRISDPRAADYSISDQVLDSSIFRHSRTPNSKAPKMYTHDRAPVYTNVTSPSNQDQQMSVLFYSKSTENVDRSRLGEAQPAEKRNNLGSISEEVQSPRSTLSNKKSGISNRVYL